VLALSEKIAFTYGAEEQDLYIQHIARTEPFERTNHYHGNYEIYLLLSGQRYYFIKDRSYSISAGDLVFINKHDVHKTSDIGDEPGHERIVINFSDTFFGPEHPLYEGLLFKPFQCANPILRLKLQDQLFVKSLLDKLIKELREQASGYELYAKHILFELLLFAARYVEKHDALPAEHLSPLHRKISEIVQHINHNYAKPVTLTGISEQFFISPYYLSRAFKEITGFTFIEYVNVTRIKHAQQLLMETGDKIIEIASQVGFENIAHFGRTFKKLTKLTPLEYRKTKL
jgi:AraC-like DNA-binding protein